MPVRVEIVREEGLECKVFGMNCSSSTGLLASCFRRIYAGCHPLHDTSRSDSIRLRANCWVHA